MIISTTQWDAARDYAASLLQANPETTTDDMARLLVEYEGGKLEKDDRELIIDDVFHPLNTANAKKISQCPTIEALEVKTPDTCIEAEWTKEDSVKWLEKTLKDYCTLWLNPNPEQALRRLVERNAELPIPLSDDEVVSIAKEGDKYAQVTTDDDSSDRIKPLSSSQLAKLPRKQVMWIIDNLLPHGVIFLAAAPKTGKTLLVQNIALAVTSGFKVLGLNRCEPGQVLCIHYEDTMDELREREDKMRGAAVNPNGLFYTEECPPLDEGGEDQIRAWLQSQPNPRMVIIDTFEYIRPAPTPGLTPYRQDVSDLKPLRRLAKEFTQVSFVVTTHTREMTSQDKLDSAYGTRGISGSIDCGWTIFPNGESKTSFKAYLVGRKVRRQEVIFKLDYDNLTWSFDGNAEEQIANDLEIKIMALFGDELRPMSPKLIAESIDENRNSVRSALTRLRGKHKLSLREDGKYQLMKK